MSLKIGVPSKGRLMEKTFDWFGARGVTMRQTGAEREYSGAVDGIDGVELVMLSAGEIPRELSAGRIHLGVTGSDLVRDKLADWNTQVAELATLGFGHADLIIAVPAAWIDVETLDDLDAAAAVDAAVVLFGHTHVACIETTDGILYVNPGCLKRGAGNLTYAVVTLTDGSITAEILPAVLP